MKRFLSIFTAFPLCRTLRARGESQPETTELSEETSAAVFATWRLKDYLEEVLKNPSSLAINSIQGGQGEDNVYFFQMDYSAQNGFGGMNRERIYLGVTAEDGCYAAKLYGSPSLDGNDNQLYTQLFFLKLPRTVDYDVETLPRYAADEELIVRLVTPPDSAE